MMVLSAGFLIHGVSTAYAYDIDDATADANAYIDQFMWYEEDYDTMQEKIRKSEETQAQKPTNNNQENPSKDKYTDDDYRGFDEVRDVINERDALVEKFRSLKKKFTEIEKQATAIPTAEEKRAAQAKWDKGSVGFFEEMGSSEATEVFKSLPSKTGYGYNPSTGPKYLAANKITNKIDENDSRSLENMKIGIESIREVNAKRQKDGGIDGKKLSVIGISDFDMAVAQANSNYSSKILEHSSVYSPPYENLAWANCDKSTSFAIKQWWDREKPVFDYLRSKGLKNRDEMESYINRHEEEMSKMFKNPQVGHYTNLVDDLMWGYDWSPEDTISAGFGLNTKGSVYTYTKSVVMNPSSPTNRTVYSIDDYEKRFMKYYNDLDSIIKGNKKIVDQDKLEEMTSLKGEMTALKSQVQAKTKSITGLKKKYKVYLDLRETIKDNRATVGGVQYLLENSPKKIAHAREKILKLLDESKAICEQAESLLKKAGIIFDY